MNNNKIYCWVGFFILIILEYCLFYNYLQREIIPFYPKSYDQTVYLQQSYQLYENILAKGRILKYLTNFPLMPQTLLFTPQAAMAFLFLGASRLSALSLNFIYFAALQLLTFAVLKSLSSRYRYGFIFCGLLLSANSIMLANDFRIDFMAACLYGMLCIAIVKSAIFLQRRWVMVSFVFTMLLVTMRYLTLCYVLGLLGTVFIYYLLAFLITKNSQVKRLIKTRLKNITCFSISLCIAILPILWLNRDIIYNYYIIGHVTGAEKLMRFQAALTAVKVAYAFLFYPRVFFISHFSFTIVAQLLIILCVYWLSLFYFHYIKLRNSSALFFLKVNFKDTLVFLLLSIVVPTLILTLDTSKSLLVINIILAPFVLALTFIYIYVSEKLWLKAPVLANYFLTFVTIFFLTSGMYNYMMHLNKERHHAYINDKNFVVTQMVDDIGNYANYLRWQKFTMSSDYLADYINAPMTPFYYERHGAFLPTYTSNLGNNSIISITKSQAFAALQQTDVYTSNLRAYPPDPIFPFEQSIAPFRQELQEYAKKTMVILGDYYIADAVLRVYVRPDIRLTGIVDGWITEQGLWLDMPAPVARQIKMIHLEGTTDFTWLQQRSLQVTATSDLHPELGNINCHLIVQGNHYQISCSMPPWSAALPLSIHLRFNHYFTRANKSAFNHVVMRAPTKKIFFK